jgi:hypothetical protein
MDPVGLEWAPGFALGFLRIPQSTQRRCAFDAQAGGHVDEQSLVAQANQRDRIAFDLVT